MIKPKSPGFGIGQTLAYIPPSSVGKESTCNAGDLGLIPGSGRSPGEGNGNPLQHPCLENPMNRGAWQATVHGVARVGHDLATKPPPAALNRGVILVFFRTTLRLTLYVGSQ